MIRLSLTNLKRFHFSRPHFFGGSLEQRLELRRIAFGLGHRLKVGYQETDVSVRRPGKANEEYAAGLDVKFREGAQLEMDIYLRVWNVLYPDARVSVEG